MQKSIIIILATILITGGCDFIEKINPFTGSVDTMEVYRQRQDSIRQFELLRRQQEEVRREQSRVATADSIRRVQEESDKLKAGERYHLIVGAFKTPSYASDFHGTILSQGHDSRILMSDNNFHLVTIRSLNDYRAAINEMISVRNQGEHYDIWLYIED
jgi:cell division protein FtsN